MSQNQKQNKSIIDALVKQGKLNYGCVIPVHDIHDAFGIIPLDDEEIQNQSLNLTDIKKYLAETVFEELAVTDLIRRILLEHGKYFEKTKDSYRVCLPSENRTRANKYFDSAQRKVKRGQTLLLNTKAEDLDPKEKAEKNNTIAKNAMLDNSIKRLENRL